MVSDKMDKTIVVAVEDRVKHRLYGKVLRQTSRLKAHDESQQRRRRRPRPDHGDPSAERHQALAPGRDPREGQVSQLGPEPVESRRWGSQPRDSDGSDTQFRQARRDGNR